MAELLLRSVRDCHGKRMNTVETTDSIVALISQKTSKQDSRQWHWGSVPREVASIPNIGKQKAKGTARRSIRRRVIRNSVKGDTKSGAIILAQRRFPVFGDAGQYFCVARLLLAGETQVYDSGTLCSVSQPFQVPWG